jgi:hypothetical protein
MTKVPGSKVYKNEIPNNYSEMDLYKDSCFKVDDSASSMKLIPQIGAFEVSYKGFVRNLCIFIVVVLKDEEWYVAQFSTSCIEGP